MPLPDPERWRVLSPLLDHALELEPGELPRWLQACATCAPSLAAELESLLAVRAAMDRDGFLEAIPFQWSRRSGV